MSISISLKRFEFNKDNARKKTLKIDSFSADNSEITGKCYSLQLNSTAGASTVSIDLKKRGGGRGEGGGGLSSTM